MGFVPWWKKEKNSVEASASQLDLLSESQELAAQRRRVDGATVNKRFNKAIKDNGGTGRVYEQAAIEETKELFGCTVGELYEATGGKRGRRETLPQAAQEAYMVSEALSANELERSIGGLSGETPEEVNGQIIGIVKEQAKQTRQWWPW